MKNVLLIAIVAAFTLAACGKEEPKKPAPEVKKEEVKK